MHGRRFGTENLGDVSMLPQTQSLKIRKKQIRMTKKKVSNLQTKRKMVVLIVQKTKKVKKEKKKKVKKKVKKGNRASQNLEIRWNKCLMLPIVRCKNLNRN